MNTTQWFARNLGYYILKQLELEVNIYDKL